MNKEEINKIINNVNANLALENMPITQEDRERMILCLFGEVDFEDMIRDLVDKYTLN